MKEIGLVIICILSLSTLISCYFVPDLSLYTLTSSEKYKIGVKGPAGGYIFYDCDADNDSGNADNLISAECGWRYLEAAPTDLDEKYVFGYYRDSSDMDDNATVGTKKGIGAGKTNTEALVSAMGACAYVDYSGTVKGTYAAKACADYSIKVNGIVYDDWFLPSEYELNLMYVNLASRSLGSFADGGYTFCMYWSSSENDYIYACYMSFSNGGQAIIGRNGEYRVRPIRAF